jgi:hypothetical protein
VYGGRAVFGVRLGNLGINRLQHFGRPWPRRVVAKLDILREELT